MEEPVTLYDRLVDELGDITDEIDVETILDDAWIDSAARRLIVTIAEAALADTDIVMVDTRAVGEL
jgi:hypothetical protein